MGWVYAIQCPARGLIKVGRTDGVDPRNRLRQLQTGQPDQLVLMHAWPCADSARSERCMHQLLDQHHYRGEWFRATPAQVVEAWARVAKGRLRWWDRLRWRTGWGRRRVTRFVARWACFTGLVVWGVAILAGLLRLF